jgi:predicted ATPase/DNA-binding winged helix-turn-helix (wHTH) protein
MTTPRPIAQDFVGAQAGIRVNVLGGIDDTHSSAKGGISFGSFRFFADRRLLLEDDKPVRLGSRALDILNNLVENAGKVVSSQELIARTWPDTFVEEGNLRVHVAALRKALRDGQAGQRYISNIAGRGYSFVAPIGRLDVSRPTVFHIPAPAPVQDSPRPVSRMIGRADVVNALVAQMAQRRLITLSGPAGIGKTMVANAVVQAVAHLYADGVCVIDLSAASEADLVESIVASELRVAVASEGPLQAIIAHLRDKQLLLVLDSCERVLEDVGRVVEDVLKNAPGVKILATSRERLRAPFESVQRLSPLAVPRASADLTVAEALGFSAVQLFVERAAAHLDGYELSDSDVPMVCNICRKLDGIPLAIEVAASRVEAFGIRGLAAILDDRFPLSMRGRRTALPRHRTLAAALDWSYEVLPAPEQMLLRRLSVFAGDFTLDAMIAVAADAADADHSADEVIDALANLVAKSLVTADISGPVVRYRLFNTTRVYARLKLAESGELDDIARRRAEYDRASAAESEPVEDSWIPAAIYSHQRDNARAA